MTAFIDTNVLLDVLARRHPFYAAASRIWTLAERGLVRAFVSAISFNNIYFITRKASGKEQADLALRLLRDVFEVVPMDARILNLAMDDQLADFEDAVQFHSAVQSRVRHLVTRDPDDFPGATITIVSPTEYLALVDLSTTHDPRC